MNLGEVLKPGVTLFFQYYFINYSISKTKQNKTTKQNQTEKKKKNLKKTFQSDLFLESRYIKVIPPSRIRAFVNKF